MIFWAGSAGRAVATGGFWSLTGTGKSLTMRLERPAPRRGAADPNAPCGASTAAPVFVDRRLLQLIVFYKLQSIDQSSGVYVFCFRLILAYLCRYLYVLDACCQFASYQAMLAICKTYCKHVSEMH